MRNACSTPRLHGSVIAKNFAYSSGKPLGKSYGTERLEAACRRAVMLGACSYKSIASILQNGLDRQPLPTQPTSPAAPHHPNIRGPKYDDEDKGEH